MVFYAVYEAEEAKYNGNITVTFFSADAATGRLTGELLLVILGSCYLDLYILIAGIIIIAAYTIRMKWLDHKEKNETEQTI